MSEFDSRRVPPTSPKRILFIGHDASRTGAPLLLLHFLRWLANEAEMPFEILLRKGGELVPEYSLIAATHVLDRGNDGGKWSGLLRRLRQRLGWKRSMENALQRRYPLRNFPLVYANTVANGELVQHFGSRGHRIICHAHEMKFGIAYWGGNVAKQSAGFVHAFVAASQSVKRDLVSMWNIDERKVEVIYEFGQPSPLSPGSQLGHRTRIRTELNIPDSAIVVGMCGTMDWRKGADLFPPLAKAVMHRAGDAGFHFLWIGSAAGTLEQLQLNHDCELLGLDRRITMVGQVSNPHEFMCAFDVFALTSREDPCPLAMLEAAALGLPIVCFAQSGGATDFVGQDAGMIVPYLDIAAMADAILKLGVDGKTRRSLGQNGKAKVMSGFTLPSQAPKLLAVIKSNLS